MAWVGLESVLIGINFRVRDGKRNGVGKGRGVYTIDPKTRRRGHLRQLS